MQTRYPKIYFVNYNQVDFTYDVIDNRTNERVNAHIMKRKTEADMLAERLNRKLAEKKS